MKTAKSGLLKNNFFKLTVVFFLVRTLVTGINGFAGSHLADYLATVPGVEIFGITKSRDSDLGNLLGVKSRVKLFACDITGKRKLKKTIQEIAPDFVFHLAGQANIPASWKSPNETFRSNVLGTLNLLEAINDSGTDPKIHLASSSEVYGKVKKTELPVTEQSLLCPFTPYGESKAEMEFLGKYFHQSFGLKVFITRAFNHSGPRSQEHYILSDWSKQVALIEKGEKRFLSVGNLNTQRDFSDVRDVVRAYWLALKKGKAGEAYNVCSGRGIAMKEILSKIKCSAKVKISVKVDKKKFRPTDLKIIFGSNKKIARQTGWKPKINFDRTIRDNLDYWREKVR